jgi:hypothetical protein
LLDLVEEPFDQIACAVLIPREDIQKLRKRARELHHLLKLSVNGFSLREPNWPPPKRS